VQRGSQNSTGKEDFAAGNAALPMLSYGLESALTDLEKVLATGPGNWPMVLVWTAKTNQFGSRPIHIQNPLLVGGAKLDLEP
jgi:hypothetical protein